MDMIQSKSEIALQNSLSQLRGNVKEKIVVNRKNTTDDLNFILNLLSTNTKNRKKDIFHRHCNTFRNCVKSGSQSRSKVY